MKRFSRVLLISVTSLLGLVAVFAGSAGAYAYAKRTIFYPNTYVGSISVAGLTQAEARQQIALNIAPVLDRTITVTIPDSTQPVNSVTGEFPVKSYQSTPRNLGVTVDTESAIKKAWEVGHQTNMREWLVGQLSGLVRGETTRVAPAYTIDPAQLDTFIIGTVTVGIAQPKPATLAITNGIPVITPDEPSISVDIEQLREQIRAIALAPTAAPGLVAAKAVTTRAKVTAETLRPLIDQFIQYQKAQIAITDVNDGVLRPNAGTLANFVTAVQQADGVVALDVNTTAISAYLRTAGPRGMDVATTTKNVQQLVASALQEAKQAEPIARTVALTRLLVTEVSPGGYEAGLYEGKYIYVSLADQKLYRINGQELEKPYIVSTGKWSTPTPRGVFAVQSKYPRAWSAMFKLWMPYWMNFVGVPEGSSEVLPDGLYGLHELPEWPNGYKEGVNNLGSAVSSGCIRLGVGDAAEMYAWADVGTPVVVR
jgi:lipoprotein-anchoring transpeptidase ErfK/SrfK